jgi:glycerol uptake facilitator-like aquaporin
VKLKLVSETVGTFFLVLVVVGSGIMGENLTSNKAIVLLANSTATFLGLTVHMYF